jgi:hypothetical protein
MMRQIAPPNGIARGIAKLRAESFTPHKSKKFEPFGMLERQQMV